MSFQIIRLKNFGQEQNIILKSIKFQKLYYPNEKIYMRLSNNNNAELREDKLIMKSSGRECLFAYTKSTNSKICFDIFNTPDLKFKEKNPIRIKTNSSKQLKIDINDYPKVFIKYFSNNPDIVKVDNEGKIEAIRPGKAVITAYGLDNITTKIKVSSIPYDGFLDNYILNKFNASSFKNVMIVAHPDDEILWGGAHLYKDNYFIVCLTNAYRLSRANNFREMLNFTKSGGIILNYPDLQDGIIDDWAEVKMSVIKDLTTLLKYKDWKKIVTHGPEGTTGHIHHKQISIYVTNIAKRLKKFNILYYFGKHYYKNEIPKNLSKISDEELEFKKKEAAIYNSSKIAIGHLYHMLPYENWLLASNWKK